jgi:hypothetical protein
MLQSLALDVNKELGRTVSNFLSSGLPFKTKNLKYTKL